MSICRKAGCLVLAAVLLGSLVLAGCKKEEKSEQQAESTAAITENSEPESAEGGGDAETKKNVLLDSDIVQLTLNGAAPFSADQDDGTTKTANPEVEISFDVTNKGEEEIVLDLRDLKVGETPVSRILLAGNIALPGETMTFRYGVLPQEPKGENGENGAGETGAVTWEMVSEQGLSGTVRIMTIERELAKVEFSTAG